MAKKEFQIGWADQQARLVVSEDGQRAGLEYGGVQWEGALADAGRGFAGVLDEARVDRQQLNGLDLFEGDQTRPFATLRPVLEGTRAVWLVLYRADRNASAFRAEAQRVRLADALTATFERLAAEVRRPHKP